jgi:predicted AAA+ superfamily ATPase
MFDRIITEKIQASAKSYKVLAMIGPRQSGKTTLAKMTFPSHRYVSLENPDTRLRASSDPRGFLASLSGGTILDEIQNVPEIFSYLQEIIDNKTDKRTFVLTGSNSFQLSDKISQSLAGRIRIFTILPLMYSEIPDSLRPSSIDSTLLQGCYPRVYDEGLQSAEWFEGYYQTYLQKDVRQIINVSDATQFDRFVRLCAGRAGSLTDYNAVAYEVGVSQPTAVRWSSVLESSFIIFRLTPHFRNFGKRVIKSPKIYFYDTGLLCQLLRIQTEDQLSLHPLRGVIFENFVISEYMKQYMNMGLTPPLYFWRDQHGHEIDLIIDSGSELIPIEIKSGAMFQQDWCKNLIWFSKLQKTQHQYLVYGGESSFDYHGLTVSPWKKIQTPQ